MLLYTPLCINLNSQFQGNKGVNNFQNDKVHYLRITPPCNALATKFSPFKCSRIYLNNNHVDLLLAPTRGTSIGSFYKVEYYCKPYGKKYKGNLLHQEYWAVPLYDKCFLNDEICSCKCAHPRSCLKCEEKAKCGVNQIKDVYSHICCTKEIFTFTPGELEISLADTLGIILIREVKVDGVLIENWVYENKVLDLSKVPGLPVVIPREPLQTFELEICYVTPLMLSDIFIQKNKCADNLCSTPFFA